METYLNAISQAISNVGIEHHENIVYQVKHAEQAKKAELKGLLSQGNLDMPHTVVEIDFVKKPVKINRKQRNNRKQAQLMGHEINQANSIVNDGTGDEPVIRIYNSSIYLYGEYKKYSREMSQTPLVIKGQPKTQQCVSDFIYEFQKFYGSEPVKFMACGREDIDVRCTGGRPFILEVPCPIRNLHATAMPIALNKAVDIVNMKVVTKDCKALINQDESQKIYDVGIFRASPIKFEAVYNLEQKTPLRVLHRRANMVRSKRIEVMGAEERCTNEGYYYLVRIAASSGAYIKEWVNGDFKRTTPNLDADLLLLDVAAVKKTIDHSTIISAYELSKKFI